ncbi:MAG TPA: protein translocase subunit SecD [Pseudonocardiaceae bacterium]|nr:protein translocase subunit SecD [Pseudonocardiaceae bacterium]
MAPPTGQIRPGRYLWVFTLIVVVLYALVFLTGDHKPSPKLGIDLSGGTTVTLTARTLNGQAPTQQQLSEAVTDIEKRVNGLGVSGAQVVSNGSNIVITVPGDQGQEAKDLGQTAKLVFRPVTQEVGAGQVAVPTTGTATPASGSQTPTSGAAASTTAKASSTATASTSKAGATSTPTAQGLPAPGGGQGIGALDHQAAPIQAAPIAHQAAATTTAAAPTTTAGTPPTSTAPAAKDTVVGGLDITQLGIGTDPTKNGECWGYPAAANSAPLTRAQQSALIKVCQEIRQTTDTNTQQAALSYLQCGGKASDPLVGNDIANQPLVACDQNGLNKYILGASFLDGTQISDATSGTDPNGAGFVVNLTFKSAGSNTWATYTSQNVGKQAAFVLDGQVVSAPTIQEAILGGNTMISGQFTQSQASDLAGVLKYGSLPLAFDSSTAQTISATLGLASLKAGLIAGAIGLALVVIYCLFYYRALGVLTVLSLALSGVTIYALLVLLGRWIGYSLDLAGVAGFIIAIGITADSFVVFFERLKDEVREGRTFRSAVPRAWVRARRTILASDAVSFLAAVVLYIFAVQDVQGFAFTLGLSTVLDLLIVFLVTHPLVALAARSKTLSQPKLSGLGAVQRAGAAARAAKSAASPAVKGA